LCEVEQLLREVEQLLREVEHRLREVELLQAQTLSIINSNLFHLTPTMTDRNITITSDPVPEDLLSTVVLHGYGALTSSLSDKWGNYHASEAFTKYLESEILSNPNTLLADVTQKIANPDLEYKTLVCLYKKLKKDKMIKHHFSEYLSSDWKYRTPFFELATDGTSSLCTDFLKFCEKEESANDVKDYMKFKALIRKDRYSDFMRNFDKFYRTSNQFKDCAISGSNKLELIKVHHAYWDSDNQKPKVISKNKSVEEQIEESTSNSDVRKVKTKKDKGEGEKLEPTAEKTTKEGKNEKSKSPKESDSNSDPPKEKETTTKKRSKAVVTGSAAPKVGVKN
jgi:hypothetical protein